MNTTAATATTSKPIYKTWAYGYTYWTFAQPGKPAADRLLFTTKKAALAAAMLTGR